MKVVEFHQVYPAVIQKKLNQLFPDERIWLLAGEEDFLRRELSFRLKELWLPEFPELNVASFVAREANWEHLENELVTCPFGANHRLLIIDFEASQKNELNRLFAILQNKRSTSSAYVLISFPDGLPKSWKLPAVPRAVWVKTSAPPAYEIPGWIVRLGERHGLTLSDEAADFIHQQLGDSLAVIDLELAKIKHLVPQGEVTLDILRSSLSISMIPTAFDLIHLFFQRKTEVFYTQLNYFFEAGESPFLLIYQMARQTRLLFSYLAFAEQKYPVTQLAQELQIPSWQIKKLHELSKLWTQQDLKRILRRLFQLEYRLKSRPLNPEWEFAHFALVELNE